MPNNPRQLTPGPAPRTPVHVDEVDLAIPGQGNCVALIAAPLRGSLVGVVAGEAVRSTTA